MLLHWSVVSLENVLPARQETAFSWGLKCDLKLWDIDACVLDCISVSCFSPFSVNVRCQISLKLKLAVKSENPENFHAVYIPCKQKIGCTVYFHVGFFKATETLWLPAGRSGIFISCLRNVWITIHRLCCKLKLIKTLKCQNYLAWLLVTSLCDLGLF